MFSYKYNIYLWWVHIFKLVQHLGAIDLWVEGNSSTVVHWLNGHGHSMHPYIAATQRLQSSRVCNHIHATHIIIEDNQVLSVCKPVLQGLRTVASGPELPSWSFPLG